MVSLTKVEDFPSYKLNRFARKLIVNFCERDKKYVSSFKCRDTCSTVQVNRLNELKEEKSVTGLIIQNRTKILRV